MYPFLESICVENGEIKNLSYHQDRLDRTYEHAFGSPAPFSLDRLIKFPDDMWHDKLKLRFLYGKNTFLYETEIYKPNNIKTLQIVFDDEIDYSFKRSDRKRINELLSQKKDSDDILIIKNGCVSDTSAANICFYDGKEWLTPDSPLLKGTCRERLLREGKIKEATIRIEDIPNYESFCLINAMLEGFDDPLPISSILKVI